MIACWRNFNGQAALSRRSHDDIFIKTRINPLLGIIIYLLIELRLEGIDKRAQNKKTGQGPVFCNCNMKKYLIFK
jgi:hypothetical protein